tara:strand:- start:410 stop:619 length:210 start_codon:yes stop_codon:yes gene_type:complete
MSKLNTLSSGYKGGSPRVRSENNRHAFVDKSPMTINSGDLTNQIKKWHADGNLTTEDINYIITQLQTIV